LTNSLDQAVAALEREAESADGMASWPESSWQALCEAGVLRWSIAGEYGGTARSSRDLLEGYEQLAAACLTTTFILSQREAACRRLRDSTNKPLRARLLPSLAEGKSFATVGLSQLTTSRQHTKPTFAATAQDAGFVFNGVIPWVTGAAKADYLVIGAVLDDDQKVLAVLPRDMAGVSVGPPLPLMALEGSLTAEVACDNVYLDRDWLLAGPAQQVLEIGRSGTGGLETTCLALGLTGRTIRFLESEAATRPDLQSTYEHLDRAHRRLREAMYELAAGTCGGEDAANLRARANTLVLRATQAALTASKGTGFLRNHPAQRWARQALFFLVWSCPRPAAEATLAYLSQPEPFACP
jgi:alkylation response protein AidB-like acyl-CoA dehydrogenase